MNELISLKIDSYNNTYEQNLQELCTKISTCSENSLILAPEVALTTFDYDNMQSASDFGVRAIEELKKIKNRAFALTIITKKDGEFYNTYMLFENGQVIHKQDKRKLFHIGLEHEHFAQGVQADFTCSINGIKIAPLICFELRFIKLWQKIANSDVILIPAMWGHKRQKAINALAPALAVANAAYVVVSDAGDSAKSDTANAIYSPLGEQIGLTCKEGLKAKFDMGEITKIRQYLKVGL